MQNIKKLLLSAAVLLASCTTDHPVAIGGIGGGLIGAGAGAAIGRASTSLTVPNAMGVGAAIGVPVGILLAYTSDATAKYYILSSNESAIRANYRAIVANQALIDEERNVVLLDAPQGLPDEDLAEYIYLGPSLANPWR